MTAKLKVCGYGQGKVELLGSLLLDRWIAAFNA